MRLAPRGTLTALWVFCAAAVSVESLPAAEDFHLFTEKFLGAEDNEVTRYVLRFNEQRFSFIPPPGWSVKSDAAKRTISVLPEDLKAGITVKFEQESDGAAPELNTIELRKRIEERYPGAKFTREYEFPIAGKPGTAFDVVRALEKNTRAGMRMVFTRYAGGMVEFELTTSAARLSDYHVVFSRMLYSFQMTAPEVKKRESE